MLRAFAGAELAPLHCTLRCHLLLCAAAAAASAAAATSAAAGPVPPQLLIDGAPLGTAAEVLELEEEGFLGGQLFVLGAST